MILKSQIKVKQQRRVLLLALYLLKNRFGDRRPTKRKVFRFILSQGLMHVPKGDNDIRSTGETVWENDLAWRREDLKEEGLLLKSEHGIWQMSEKAEREVEAWAERIKQMADSTPDWVADFKAHADPEAEYDDEYHYEYYITEETIRWAIKIASNKL